MRASSRPHPYQAQLYNIAIYEDATVLTLMKNGEPHSHFLVNEQDLAKIFNVPAAMTLRPEPGLVYVKEQGRMQTYLFQIAPRKTPWEIILRDNIGAPPRHVYLHLPGFFISLTLESKTRLIAAVSAQCYAGKKPVAGNPLYEFPLPNFDSRGRMCLGAAKVQVAKQERVRDAALRVVFETEFNNHSNLVGKKGLPFDRFLEQHQGKAPIVSLEKTGTISADMIT